MMKKVAAKRPTKRPAKKKPAKRKTSYSDPMVNKLLGLKYRINDAYRDGAPGLLPDKSDKDFVMGLIHNIRKRNDYPTKIQLIECNKLWKISTWAYFWTLKAWRNAFLFFLGGKWEPFTKHTGVFCATIWLHIFAPFCWRRRTTRREKNGDG